MDENIDREALLQDIVERELVMFLATPNAGGQSPCQRNPGAFRIMRRMMHCTSDDATLISYANDLREAERTQPHG